MTPITVKLHAPHIHPASAEANANTVLVTADELLLAVPHPDGSTDSAGHMLLATTLDERLMLKLSMDDCYPVDDDDTEKQLVRVNTDLFDVDGTLIIHANELCFAQPEGEGQLMIETLDHRVSTIITPGECRKV